jgi:hypothetical protein
MSIETITGGAKAAAAKGAGAEILLRRPAGTHDSPSLGPVERILVHAGTEAGDAVCRVVIGVLLLPAGSFFWPRAASWQSFTIVLLIILLILRLVPLVVRRRVPFSREASRIWSERRELAKRYDCYQWQKLFWIGLGLAFYSILSGQWRDPRFEAASTAVSAFCLLSGGAGLALWRWKRRTISQLVIQQDS